MARVDLLCMEEFEPDTGEWNAAKKWLEEMSVSSEWKSKVSWKKKEEPPRAKFLLGIFVVGENGKMELHKQLVLYHHQKITDVLQVYCKTFDIKYFQHNWVYASDETKDYPEEGDTPESLGWPKNGCAVISCIFGEDFRKSVFARAPRPVTHGKMSRLRKDFVPSADVPECKCSGVMCSPVAKNPMLV